MPRGKGGGERVRALLSNCVFTGSAGGPLLLAATRAQMNEEMIWPTQKVQTCDF